MKASPASTPASPPNSRTADAAEHGAAVAPSGSRAPPPSRSSSATLSLQALSVRALQSALERIREKEMHVEELLQALEAERGGDDLGPQMQLLARTRSRAGSISDLLGPVPENEALRGAAAAAHASGPSPGDAAGPGMAGSGGPTAHSSPGRYGTPESHWGDGPSPGPWGGTTPASLDSPLAHGLTSSGVRDSSPFGPSPFGPPPTLLRQSGPVGSGGLSLHRRGSWGRGRPSATARDRALSIASSGGGSGGSAASAASLPVGWTLQRAGASLPLLHRGDGTERLPLRAMTGLVRRTLSRAPSLGGSAVSGDLLAALGAALDGQEAEPSLLERLQGDVGDVGLFEPGIAAGLASHLGSPRNRLTAAWLQGTLLFAEYAPAAEGESHAGDFPFAWSPEGPGCASPGLNHGLESPPDVGWAPLGARGLLTRPGVLRALAGLATGSPQAWSLDAFALAEATADGDAPAGRPMSVLGLSLLRMYGLFELLPLTPERAWETLQAIEGSYRAANPYHNATHAADVAFSTHCLLSHGGLVEAGLTDPLDVFALLMAAMVHDVGHPGLNNDFLVRTEHPIALAHNDRSPLENHHCALAWGLLTAGPEGGLIGRFTREDRARLRATLLALVLSTDLKEHFESLAVFQKRFGALVPQGTSPLGASLGATAVSAALAAAAAATAVADGGEGPTRSASSLGPATGGSQGSDAQLRLDDLNSNLGSGAPLRLLKSITWGDAGGPFGLEEGGEAEGVGVGLGAEGLDAEGLDAEGLDDDEGEDEDGAEEDDGRTWATPAPTSVRGRAASRAGLSHTLGGLSQSQLSGEDHAFFSGPVLAAPADRLAAMAMCLKCADLGHLSRPLDVHCRWVQALQDEMWLQGDAEAAHPHLTVNPSNDRSHKLSAKSQMGFFEVIVLPMTRTMRSVFPAVGPFSTLVEDTWRAWATGHASRVFEGLGLGPVTRVPSAPVAGT